MADKIREAFQKVKEDITDLRKKTKNNKDELYSVIEDFSSIKKDISYIKDNKDNYKEELAAIHNKLDLLFDFQRKEIGNIKRQLTLLKKDGAQIDAREKLEKEKQKEKEEKPFYESPVEAEGESISEEDKKKKGWFSKMVDFLAEEDE